MKSEHNSPIAVVGIVLLFASGAAGISSCRRERPNASQDRMAHLPRIFLWAWERPLDLRFLNPDTVGVAVLAKRLILDGSQIRVFPRLQPIELPPGIATLAVVRIDTISDTMDAGLKDRVFLEIRKLFDGPAAGIQIDFDARVSERTFYRRLIEDLRQAMPSGKSLSITALASWCLYDDWISGLPVDEAVPMLFRMGADGYTIRNRLAPGKDFLARGTRFSLGLSIDEMPEMPARIPHGRRIYLFNPEPWTEESVNRALNFIKKLR